VTRRPASLLLDALRVGLSLVVATAGVALVERWTGVPNASVLYLVAVVACGLTVGTAGAILAAVGAFLVYTYLFTEPLHAFSISDPAVLLSVVLFLFVGIVVGQLAAVQRARATAAEAREREARAMFTVSRVLATRESTEAALAMIVEALRAETGMARVWIALGADPGAERIAADSGDPADRSAAGGSAVSNTGRVRVLQQTPGNEPARWSLVVRPSSGRRPPSEVDIYRVRIEASGEPIGSIWSERPRDVGEPDPIATRLLAAAADQVGQALARDRVAAETKAADVARASDALKSSLLQSVSHDFRTPLAVIRAAAGSLAEEHGLSDVDRRANLAAIDREVEYLNRLVANLLDLSRIEAGSLRAATDVYDIDDLVSQALERVRPRLGGRTLDVELDTALVRVDPVFLDAAVANVLDNALKYTPATARIRVAARRGDDGMLVVSIEDDGPGVPRESIRSLFQRFYRVPGVRGDARGGLGIGLAVVRGLMEAMGGRAAARQSTLGGLAIDLVLPLARVPAAVPSR
jgi:two-component system sensor histidine kinase KdpD